MNIEVKFNNKFMFYEKTFLNKRILVKGYCIFEDQIYTELSFINLINKYSDTIENVEYFLNKIDGLFIFYIETEDNVIFSVDLIRSLPIFYSLRNSHLVISDDANYIKSKLKLDTLNNDNIEEFIATCFVSGNQTLIDNLYQVESGQFVVFRKSLKTILTKNYFYYHASKAQNKNIDELYDKIQTIESNAFSKLVKSLNNKTCVIPLSGGYDSRYIVSMLKKLNYKKVICYTYGKEDSFEVNISKKVADQLGFEWIYINYTEPLIKETVNSLKFKDFNIYASGLSSVPHFQDFIAVNYLHTKKLIPEDSVFIPGHSGDLLGGSHLRGIISTMKSKYIHNLNDLSTIIKKHFYKTNYANSTNLDSSIYKEKIDNYFLNFKNYKTKNYIFLSDTWDISNRQAKFIVNSCRVYDFFNYEFRLPLFDKELSLFWLSIPIKYKLNQILYENYLDRVVFSKEKIAFSKRKIVLNNSFKILLKRILGEKIFGFIKKILLNKKQDEMVFNCFNLFNKHMSKTITSKEYQFSHFHIDHMSAVWCLQLLKECNDNNN